MEGAASAMSNSCVSEEGSSRGRLSHRRVYGDTKIFKSKNLEAERRRRQKLSDRLLVLRSMVPVITNMNKMTIIEDAITYIQELQRTVQVLGDLLPEMKEEVLEEEEEEEDKTVTDQIDPAKQMKLSGMKEEVLVTNVDGNKLWIKIIFEKKRGRFAKLIEAMTDLGLEFTDTSVTTSKGAILVSSCVEVKSNKGTYGDKFAVQRIKDLLLEIIKGI